jgi:hypothetical protein
VWATRSASSETRSVSELPAPRGGGLPGRPEDRNGGSRSQGARRVLPWSCPPSRSLGALVGDAYSVQQLPYVLSRSTLRLHVRTLGSSRPEHFTPGLTLGGLSSHRVGLSFGDLARHQPANHAPPWSGASGIAPFGAALVGHDGRPHMRLLLPFGVCSRVRPRSIRRRFHAPPTPPPAGNLTLVATPLRVSRCASFAPGVSPTRARRSAPCPDLLALFHTSYTLGVGFRSYRGFPSATVAVHLSARRFPQQSPLRTIRA